MTTLLARWFASAAVFLAVIATSVMGFWSAADTKLAEVRFAASDRAPSGDIVFIDIDARSLAEVGLWPWPRSIHGELIDNLMALGAYEVALDIDFSAASTPPEDDAFAASLERAGGYVFLSTFRQTDAKGALVINQPLPQFAEYADSVLANVEALESGMVRAVPARVPGMVATSVAVVFSPTRASPQTIRIDYSIDLRQIVRIPAIDVLNGAVDPALVRDRQVVVGASAIELHDLFDVPRFGTVPGPMVQIAAAETLKLDRALLNLSIWPALGLVGLLVLGVTVFRRASVPKVAGVLAAVAVAVELAALLALTILKIDVATMPVHVGLLSLIVLRLLDERVVRHRQLREQRARLAYLANHDIRTGAMSRTAWIDALDAIMDRGTPLWIVLLRLDRLDAAGASLGYEIVEAAIAMAHARLRELTPGMVARIESDAFAMSWLRRPDDAEIHSLLAAIEQPYEIGQHRVALELRWGASGEISNAVGASPGLQRARIALAAAGNLGQKGCDYDDSFEAELRRRQLIDIDLRQAIANGELDIAFQSQVDMRTRRVVGVEALLRWNSTRFGPVSPADFIPMAEENGTIIELGAWVFAEACRRTMLQGWGGRLSINVSPIQFQRGDVVGMVRSALEATDFPADRLDIEITESLFVDQGNQIRPALDALRSMGAQIAIDDFGTGYSSLSHLSGLPVDKLKIDQSFVRQLSDRRGAGVMEAIVSLGQRLGLVIVVEGVETEAELDQLTSLGCHVAQGYLFGRPGSLPVTEDGVAA
ncbi:putative bifunctional diguanylate cyclase/phosphodiesterase [Devosia sp. SL43]|uniref:putative bifunctional diguanylate cyclase/phosphodiesterase n=1 Tax=Devosia sp. SL43 TaxID=2806348 RepID=UPI001F2AC914|nr:EAL domain-containing protein [Devosia sp. SL43]UJW86924.1 EAL domain-containing protein [Devosia sp. SL43]